MNDSQIKIRRGKVEDAEQLTSLAIKIFNDTFAGNPLNKPEDMQAYTAEAFSLEQIRHELADKETIVFIVEADNQMIGFAKLLEHSTEECIDDKDSIEIQRFYIAGEYHGRGIAQELMDECLAVAKLKQYKTIWLGVWEFNYRAQRFYEKLGFKKVGTHIFQLGNDSQTDWVMSMNL